MFGFLKRFFRLFEVTFFVLSPFLAHFILISDPEKARLASLTLFICQGLLLGILFWPRFTPPFRFLVLAPLIMAVVTLCSYHLQYGALLSSCVPHTAVYMGLLCIFGVSLLPTREPLVTYFARMIHGNISNPVQNYTRSVTWVWFGFCAFQLLASAALLTLAPINWWSTFVNIINFPLIAAMFLGEQLCRPLWVADPPREGLRDILRMSMLLKQSLELRTRQPDGT